MQELDLLLCYLIRSIKCSTVWRRIKSLLWLQSVYVRKFNDGWKDADYSFSQVANTGFTQAFVPAPPVSMTGKHLWKQMFITYPARPG